MSRIKSKDTAPEMRVRRALHARGYRFRVHRKDLPGTPDIVLPRFENVLIRSWLLLAWSRKLYKSAVARNSKRLLVPKNFCQ